MAAGLEIKDLSIRFGGIVALDGVSFSVEPRQIVALIGPNGAGKTTCFNCVSRLYTPNRGRLSYNDADLLRIAPDGIVRLGIARTFQNLELFRTMSVMDNLLVGQTSRGRTDLQQLGIVGGAGLVGGGVMAAIGGIGGPVAVAATAIATGISVTGLSAVGGFRLPYLSQAERDQRARADEVLGFLNLRGAAGELVSSLPYGIQKRVDIARALVSRPSLLLMDEPAAGLSHEDMGELGALIRRIRDEFHVAVLLVEHHMQLVMGISDKVCVLDFGRKIAEGTPAAVQSNPAVIEAYLGVSEETAGAASD